jgi:hypothetical protein
MRTHFIRFLRNNLLLSFGLSLIGLILFLTVLPAFYHPFIPLLLLFALSINLILYFVVIRKEVNDTMLLSMVVKSFAIKFFSYIALVIIFLILEKTRVIRITFVIVLFVFYFSFTWLEIQSLLKFLKSGKNK